MLKRDKEFLKILRERMFKDKRLEKENKQTSTKVRYMISYYVRSQQLKELGEEGVINGETKPGNL